MKAIRIKAENGLQAIVNPAMAVAILPDRVKGACALVLPGQTLKFRLSADEMAKALEWKVAEAPAPRPSTPKAATKEESEGPAKKNLDGNVKKGKVKSARASVKGKSGVSA